MTGQRLHLHLLAVLAALLGSVAAGCGPARPPGPPAGAWVDQPVTFPAGGVVVYATYRHPVAPAKSLPAALLIAGSGPTNRDGDSPAIPGPVGTLKTVADWLSTDGVASLRYDKLGSGQTGVGPFAGHPEKIDLAPFQEAAAAALSFLAREPGVDRNRLAVFGHSEGGLFALLLATGAASIPPIHALGLLEPLSVRYLDLIANQLDASATKAAAAGQITPAQAAQLIGTVANVVHELRTTGSLPPNLPRGISAVLNPGTAPFLLQADRYDPGQVAAHLAPHLPVLVTCSDADIQVACTDVDHLVAGLMQAPAATDFVHLIGVDHVLKEDPSGSASNYGNPLPASTQLRNEVRSFVGHNL